MVFWLAHHQVPPIPPRTTIRKTRIMTTLLGPSPGIETEGIAIVGAARFAPPPRFVLVGARELRLMRIIVQSSSGPNLPPRPAVLDSVPERSCLNPSTVCSVEM